MHLILSCQDDFHDITEEDEELPDFEDQKWLTEEACNLLQDSASALNDLSQSLRLPQKNRVSPEAMVEWLSRRLLIAKQLGGCRNN